ncbi:transposase [Streptomyces sp. BG9H]|uniref:Transposase n=1 Tax=Streptomyces anatolicus TaxID=2675858 RepID=A0ABS6YFC9_9ACTN|nr:transposase [Streptomyces anatolicus]
MIPVRALHGDNQDVGRGDLPDEQWTVLESLLPGVGISRRWPGCRRLVNGVRWRARTGVRRRHPSPASARRRPSLCAAGRSTA